jgi:hypothetical protein
MKNLSHDNRSPGQDLNLGPPKQDAGTLTTYTTTWFARIQLSQPQPSLTEVRSQSPAPLEGRVRHGDTKHLTGFCRMSRQQEAEEQPSAGSSEYYRWAGVLYRVKPSMLPIFRDIQHTKFHDPILNNAGHDS